ncbi:MAG: hypothetical protein ACI8XU_002482 [Kiritimatiellia bacterium]|jgi:hypothetical protein
MQDDNETNIDQDLAQSVEDAKVSIDELQGDSETKERNKGINSSTQTYVLVAFAILWAGLLWFQGPKLLNPYDGIDPLAESEVAENYLYALMSELEAWQIENGSYPDSLESAIQSYQLPDSDSQYSVSYLKFADTVDLELLGPGSYVVRVSSSDE